jgi:hypothetical protein
MFRRLFLALALGLYACCAHTPPVAAAGKHLWQLTEAGTLTDSTLFLVSMTDTSQTGNWLTLTALKAALGVTSSATDTVVVVQVDSVTSTSVVSTFTVTDTLTIDTLTGLLRADAGLVSAVATLDSASLTDGGVSLADLVRNGASGQVIKWDTVAGRWTAQAGTSILPSQTGEGGHFLTTDGSALSWGTPAGAGDMLAADFADSLSDGLARDTTVLKRAALDDSLATNYGIQESGTAWVDSTHIKAGAIAGTDLRIDLVDSTKVRNASLSTADLAGGGALTLDELTLDTLKLGSPPRWFLPLPTVFDSITVAEQDSGEVKVAANVTDTSERAVYLEYVGNGTATVDTLIMADTFLPYVNTPDSCYLWVWSDSNNAAEAAYEITISRKGTAAADTATVSYKKSGVVSASTWERVALPLYQDFTNDTYLVSAKAILASGYRVRLSKIYFR